MSSITGQTGDQAQADMVFAKADGVPQDWASTLRVLELAQIKYSTAKKQLDDLYRTFEETDSWVASRLRPIIEQYVLSSSSVPVSTAALLKAPSARKVKTAPEKALLRVFCMGSFQLYLNQEKVDHWHSQKARSMMKYLLTRRKKAITRDELVEALWPNCDAEVGRNNLKAAVYSLRQTLSACTKKGDVSQVILFQEGQYSINPGVEVLVDTDEFELYWQTGRRLEREGKKQQALQQYMLAEQIYKGDYFEDDLYSEWTMLQREALKDNYLAILSKLAAHSFESGDYENCAHYSQLLLYKDICHEEAYRWLIKCNIALEQYNRAHRWFKVCSDVLRKELDITPDQKTVELYYHLVQITTGKKLFSIS